MNLQSLGPHPSAIPSFATSRKHSYFIRNESNPQLLIFEKEEKRGMDFRTKKDDGIWFFDYGNQTGPADIISMKIGTAESFGGVL